MIIKAKNDIIKIVFIMMILVFLLMLLVLISIFSSSMFGIGNPEKAVNEDNFSKALIDSVNMYGVDFTGALAVYMKENRDFEDYKSEKFKYSRSEIKEMIKEDRVKKLKKKFDEFYGGMIKEKEGKTYYNWYFPISDGYEVTNSNDWGAARTNGRSHKGNDIMCKQGIPIIAVESGEITNIGWNELGGWRIGITSTVGERYWFYGHMRKIHPYVKSLNNGSKIEGGQVIGYIGSTGYSNIVEVNSMPENENAVDGKFATHLHVGIFKNMTNAYNPFPVMELLKANKIKTMKKENEYVEVKKSIDERLIPVVSYDVINVKGGLGSLSAKYESSGEPGTIADNQGDWGGKSYGLYQLAVNMGSMDSFLMWLKGADVKIYNRLISARIKDGGYGVNFDSEWKSIAREQREHFANLQHSYIKISYYDPVVDHFKGKIDFNKRSKALQNTIWSTSVQHGVGGAINIISKQNLKGTDREIIVGIYNERMKVGIYFANSSPSIRAGVYKRFEQELQEALAMLQSEGG
jgi:hypothetical protein